MTNILLVEDDKGIIENLTAFLTNEGYGVKYANGQKDALALVENERYLV